MLACNAGFGGPQTFRSAVGATPYGQPAYANQGGLNGPQAFGVGGGAMQQPYGQPTMSITMSSASLPVFNTMLGNLNHILDKAQAFADAKKCGPLALTQFRLAPDMFPFSRQILIACDTAKNGVARLSGVEAPKYDDTEVTIPEFKARIQKTLDYLATVPASALDGTEEKVITFKAGPVSRTMPGEAYLTRWLLPNLFFHISMAYALLRHNGVELGKLDYLTGGAD